MASGICRSQPNKPATPQSLQVFTAALAQESYHPACKLTYTCKLTYKRLVPGPECSWQKKPLAQGARIRVAGLCRAISALLTWLESSEASLYIRQNCWAAVLMDGVAATQLILIGKVVHGVGDLLKTNDRHDPG